MTAARNPYARQPARAFWKRAVSDRHWSRLDDLGAVPPDFGTARVATAGSCFAQHIGHNLRTRGLNYLDLEPAPAVLRRPEAPLLGYGVFSCRYGNIYTTRQLVQLFEEAHGRRTPVEGVWEKDGRFYDALRPAVEPGGFGSVAELAVLRAAHLARVREMFRTLDIFVFTLGLTEAWVSTADGTAYPTAPGVIAGSHDPARYRFLNLRHGDVVADLEAFRAGLRAVNPGARMLLTVSPVSLAATATGDHVLVATTYSKAVLRAAAGELAQDHADVSYFPSYEIIAGQPARHGFYEPDLRSVSAHGVAEVMRHLFGALPARPKAPASASAQDAVFGYEQCEESLLADAGRP